MSLEVTAHAGQSVGLAAALQSLIGSIRTGLKVRRVADDMCGMTDRHLQDIGLDRPLLSDAWERAVARDRLLESGWRYSQRV